MLAAGNLWRCPHSFMFKGSSSPMNNSIFVTWKKETSAYHFFVRTLKHSILLKMFKLGLDIIYFIWKVHQIRGMRRLVPRTSM